jgi:hypothetical protein
MNKNYCFMNIFIAICILCFIYLLYRYGKLFLPNFKEGLNSKPVKGCTKPTKIDGNCVGPDQKGSSFKEPDGTYYKNCRYQCTTPCDLKTADCINQSWCLSNNDCLKTGKVTNIPSRHNNEQPQNKQTYDKHGCEKGYKFCGNDFFPACQPVQQPCINKISKHCNSSLGEEWCPSQKKCIKISGLDDFAKQCHGSTHNVPIQPKQHEKWCEALGEYITLDVECPFNPNILQRQQNQVIDYNDPIGNEKQKAAATKASAAKAAAEKASAAKAAAEKAAATKAAVEKAAQERATEAAAAKLAAEKAASNLVAEKAAAAKIAAAKVATAEAATAKAAQIKAAQTRVAAAAKVAAEKAAAAKAAAEKATAAKAAAAKAAATKAAATKAAQEKAAAAKCKAEHGGKRCV